MTKKIKRKTKKMINKDLVYKFISKNIKARIELVANPRSYYGSNKVEADYILRIHKIKLGEAFIHKIEFEGEDEGEVFAKAYKFIKNRGIKKCQTK